MNTHIPLPPDGRLSLRDPAGPCVRMIAVGDLSLHGRVAEAVRTSGPEVVFAGVRSALAPADLRVGNLETVLSRERTVPQSRKAQHIAGPEAAAALHLAGFEVLTFANNHIFDKGPSGVLETIDLVRQTGGAVVGAGADAASARKPVIVAPKGFPVGFLAYSYAMGQIAGPHTPGCNEDRLENILADLARESLGSSVRIVTLHADAEFQPTPAPARVAFCRRLVEGGAHLVLCHHPHVPQGIERWGDGIIVYSLGNYVTPLSPYMMAHSDQCDTSFHLDVVLDSQGVCSAEAVGVRIDATGCPYLPDDHEQRLIRGLLASLSAKLTDPEDLAGRYRRMVRAWGRETARAIYWSLRKFDWGGVALIIGDLLRTRCKQKWLRDWLVGGTDG